MTLIERTNQTVDQILATMTDTEIEAMTEDEMQAIATGVGLILVPE